MDTISWKVVILGAMPEAMLILWAGLRLLGIRPNMRRLLLVGILQGISSYYVRKYTGFGPHTVILFVTMVLYACLIMRVTLPVAMVAVAMAFSVVILVEGIAVIYVKDDMRYILSNDWMRILLFLPQEMVLVIIALYCKLKGVSLQQESRFLSRITKISLKS